MDLIDTLPAARNPEHDARQHALQLRLAGLNARRTKPSLDVQAWHTGLATEFELRLEEAAFLESQIAALRPLLAELPTDTDGFMRWFEALRESGPGQGDPLFPWLAEHATMQQMRWFLAQEIGGEAGFDDLVALTQVGFDDRPKLEMARNYWDEMGRGNPKGMHGPMLSDAARELDVVANPRTTVWQALALSNLMAGLAHNRHYAYQSVGALGAIEMTAPGRVTLVNAGLRRLGVSTLGRRYFQLHAGLDVKHSEEWNQEVLRPLVAEHPRCARALAEGALLRLTFGQRCFASYRRHLGVTA